MPRLQILELPEGSNDDQPPFLLVVDQVNADAAEAIANAGLTTAELIGARAVLVFEETVDIPANDTSAYLEAGAWSMPDELRAQIQEEIAKAHAELIDALNRQTQR